jgi:WD40 repeat protein
MLPYSLGSLEAGYMFNQTRVLVLTGTLILSVLAVTPARSDGMIIGLVDNKFLVTIDPMTRKVISEHTIRGVGTRIVGFDSRPADGLLYGVASNGEIYTLDPKSGQSTKRSKLTAPWKSGITTTIDFDPSGDRLRVMGSNGVNASVNVEDGKVTLEGSHKYKEGDINAGKIPKIIAGAYIDSTKGVQATALYTIDVTTRSLVAQDPPNEGLLTTIGAVGITLMEPVAFDIVMVGNRNDAMLTSNGILYSVDLATGRAALVGKIDGLRGKLIDIAWVK